MNARRDPDRLIDAFLHEGAEQLHDQVYDAVRASIEHRRQRVVFGPWRFPDMSKFIPMAVGAVAVVAAVAIGVQVLRPPSPGGVGAAPASPSATASPTAAPTSTPKGSLSEGRVVWYPRNPPDDPVSISVDIPSSGWVKDPTQGWLAKGDLSDPPEAAMLEQSTTAGVYVYGDPCHWKSTTPDAPAKTVDDIVGALSAQPGRHASEPVAATIGGFSGKLVTLRVPDDAADRATAFGDCDNDTYASYAVGSTDPTRWHQGPGQIDAYWVLEHDGVIVIINAMYRPNTPDALVQEMRSIAESATFE